MDSMTNASWSMELNRYEKYSQKFFNYFRFRRLFKIKYSVYMGDCHLRLNHSINKINKQSSRYPSPWIVMRPFMVRSWWIRKSRIRPVSKRGWLLLGRWYYRQIPSQEQSKNDLQSALAGDVGLQLGAQ